MLRIVVVPHLPSSPTHDCRGWWRPAGIYQSIIYSHFGLHTSLYRSRLSMLYIKCFECDLLQRHCIRKSVGTFKRHGMQSTESESKSTKRQKKDQKRQIQKDKVMTLFLMTAPCSNFNNWAEACTNVLVQYVQKPRLCW